jgi:hypothetical protein
VGLDPFCADSLGFLVDVLEASSLQLRRAVYALERSDECARGTGVSNLLFHVELAHRDERHHVETLESGRFHCPLNVVEGCPNIRCHVPLASTSREL